MIHYLRFKSSLRLIFEKKILKFWTHFYFESHSSCSILNLNLSQNENFENQLLPQIFHQKTSNILWTQSCKHHDADISNIKRIFFYLPTYLFPYDSNSNSVKILF